jgi:hypothetical protein
MMNERIQELSKEAWHQVDVSKIKGRHRAYTKIFAELLLQECIALGTNFTNRNYSEDAGERIAKNFGVEL